MNIRMLGYNISNEMRMNRVTYRELGRRVNKEHSVIANHILEPNKITVQELLRVAAALGIDWRKLMEGVDE